MIDPLELLRRLFAHDKWAREQLLALAGTLSDEEFARPLGVLDSLSSRLAHIADIDALWLRRIYHRESPAKLPSRHRFTNFEELAALLWQVTQEREAAISRLAPKDLDEVLEFRDTLGNPYRETVGDMLMQVVLHSAHHRGQVTLCLKALGKTVPDTDFYLWAGRR